MIFLTDAAWALHRWRLVGLAALRRRLVAAVVMLAIATGAVCTPRQAEAVTLIELVMAIVALGIVAAVAIPRFIDLAGNAQQAAIEGIAGSVATAVGNLSTPKRPVLSLASPLSCPVFSTDAKTSTILTEDECVWAKAEGQWTAQSGATDSTAVLRIGGQKEVARDWFLGGSFAAGSLSTQNGSATNGTGQIFDGSIALKHTIGPWLLAGAMGFSSAATRLNPSGPGLAGDVNVYGAGLRLRGAYDFAFNGWYVRPRLDLDLIHTYRPGFTLSAPGGGAFGPIGLAVEGFSKTNFVATPMVELGGRYDIDERTILRPYVAVGASFLPDNNSTTRASFTGPLAVIGSFQSTSSGPSVLGNLEAGLQLYRTRGLEVKAEYTLAIGNNYLSQGASLRGAYHF
jgi:outer membrane autotransporter protein